MWGWTRTAKFPHHWRNDPSKIYDFCAAIVDATADLVIAFKPQIAYFQPTVPKTNWNARWRTCAAAPQVPIILDAKRDIGSTAEQYAKEAFERYGADAVTLSPFMGFDSVQPYLRYPGKGAFLLCRTSNPGRRFPAPALGRHGRPAALVRTHRVVDARAVEPERSTGLAVGADLSGRNCAGA